MIIILAKKQHNPSLEEELELLSDIKKELKENHIVRDIFKDLNKDLSVLDGIPIDFSDEIDVSAKTVNSRILLNKSLIGEDFDVIMRYVIHELVHSLQHIDRDGMEDPYEGEEYLDRPDELEAFQYQVEFDSEARGKKEAEKYVEDLMDYHNLSDDEKASKKRELLNRV